MILPSKLYAQENEDSVKFINRTNQSLLDINQKIDSIKDIFLQISDNQYVIYNIDSNRNKLAIDSIEHLTSTSDKLSHSKPVKRLSPILPFSKSDYHLEQDILPDDNLEVDVLKISSFPMLEVDFEEPISSRFNSKAIIRISSRVKSYLKNAVSQDSINAKQVQQKVEEYAVNNIKELQELSRLESSVNEVRTRSSNFKWDKSKISSSKNISEALSGNIESVQAAMGKMDRLKTKYSKLNLMHPDGPIMKKIDEKPIKRWQLGLNFSSQFQNGFSLQLAPTLGYKIFERWIGGVGLSYQNKIFDIDSSFAISPKHQFSHRIFNQYNFYKNFFLHAEHELPYKQKVSKADAYWHELVPQQARAWAGIAMQYDIYKSIKGQTQILYNFIKPDQLTESRWTIRVNLLF